MFSICMLTYNNHDTFQRSLQSMTPLLLDDRVTELIILDNGSHEKSLRNLLQRTEKMYSKVKVYYSSENLGIAKGRKFLFDLSQGEYILSFDSDIVIIDAPNLLAILLEAFKNKDIWLIGGGGGNHPYFPSLFREYINNLKEAEDPRQLTFVEEVAGWFHGFRSSMLVKNGGQVYMDEIFTPFWGEDSDFCMQIRVLGGKCAILGRGLVGHRWSSCDKKDTQKTIEEMWKKFTDKWYPKFGDTFNFDFDEDFYLKYYGKEKKHKDAIVDYLLEGMKRNFIANPRFLSKLYNFKYKGDKILYDNQEYEVPQFIDRWMNKKDIVATNFRTIDNRLQDHKYLVVLHSDDDKKGVELLKKLKLKNDSFGLAFCYPKFKKHTKSLDFINDHFSNFMTSTFIDYDSHTIANIVTYENIGDKKFEKVVFLNTSYSSEFVKNSLVHLNDINYEGEKVKTDIRTIDAINDVYLHRDNLEYYKEGVFVTDAKKLSKAISTISVQKLLERSLLIPTSYSLHLSPRQTPKHSLERLLGYMLMRPDNDRTLIVIDGKIESEEDIKRCAQNNKFFKVAGECDIMVMNRGTIKHLKASQLNSDYYYLTQSGDSPLDNWKNAFGLARLEDYNNVILATHNFDIESEINEFFDLAKYSNITMLEENKIIDTNLISLQASTVGAFFHIYDEIKKAMKDKPDINEKETFSFNIRRNLHFTALWQGKKVEDEEEICFEYFRLDDKFEPDQDFPLIFELDG